MKNAALSLLAVVAFAASTLVIVDRLRPPPSQSPSGPPATPSGAPTSQPARSADADAAVLKRLAAVEASLKSLAALLRPEADPTRPADAAPPPSITQRLEELETAVFDLERNARREIRLLYDKTRRRFDELDAAVEKITAKPATPEDKAKVVADLATKGVALDVAARRIEVKGQCGHPMRVLEFLAAAPGGPTHESLFVVDALPSALHRAAKELGLAQGAGPNFETGKPPSGDGLYVYVTWEGRPTPVRIERLVKSQKSGEKLRAGPLVFVGSRSFLKDDTWEAYYAADVYKNLVGLTFNYSADSVFAPSDPACADEHVWIPDADAMPPSETEVRLIFTAEAVPAWDA